jgi:uncharacterized protein with PIN domain
VGVGRHERSAVSASRIKTLRSLRCVVCNRRTTEAEVQEMYEDFGQKFEPGEKLVWECNLCGKKKGKA